MTSFLIQMLVDLYSKQTIPDLRTPSRVIHLECSNDFDLNQFFVLYSNKKESARNTPIIGLITPSFWAQSINHQKFLYSISIKESLCTVKLRVYLQFYVFFLVDIFLSREKVNQVPSWNPEAIFMFAQT